MNLIGPFSQLITMRGLPLKGPLHDDQLEIHENAGILTEGETVRQVGNYDALRKEFHKKIDEFIETGGPAVALPGFIDPHTHICWAGSRANDYAMRIAGKTYLEIAKEGGGIWQTVTATREASEEELHEKTIKRVAQHLRGGVTTIEAKSGYGLNLENELKMLRVIKKVGLSQPADMVGTCLSAHIVPGDFDGGERTYLDFILNEILPIIHKEKLASRVDIFIEEGAFHEKTAISFLKKAAGLGFDITIHGDQFTPAGSRVAVVVGAVSVDHLEASGETEINMLAHNEVVATVLPGASLGLGMTYAPARKLLDAGATVAIGSDWNPGSAPMGDLLTQAALLSASEKLTNAETFAGLTFRAAKALNLHDRGTLAPGMKADIVVFPCADYREILYHQGRLRPDLVIKNGMKVM